MCLGIVGPGIETSPVTILYYRSILQVLVDRPSHRVPTELEATLAAWA